MAARAADGIGADLGRSDADHLEAGIGELADLDDTALRRRWRRLIGRPLPPGLGRALAIRILAYHQQAQHCSPSIPWWWSAEGVGLVESYEELTKSSWVKTSLKALIAVNRLVGCGRSFAR